MLMLYDWPGNIRELENTMHRYFTLNQFDLLHSSGKIRPPSPVPGSRDLKTALEAYEKDLVRAALEHSRWHRGRAAEQLGINRRTLFKKMKIHGLDHT
ncbi:MAG: helix-turn-helix domain-containing protein, partial [Thermodesulfobacteriota bacterium]